MSMSRAKRSGGNRAPRAVLWSSENGGSLSVDFGIKDAAVVCHPVVNSVPQAMIAGAMALIRIAQNLVTSMPTNAR
jgi:hypothetical protein